jgi:mannosyl-3-phosphoglycerate phosphatase
MDKRILIFTDLDGTLLDHYTYQTDKAAEMIEKLKANEIAIIPNSSKTASEILLIRQQLVINTPFIIENGAAVYIPINYFQQQPNGTHIDNGYWVKPFCESKDHWINLLAEKAIDYKANFKGFSEMDVSEVAELTGLSEENAAMAKQRQYGEPLNWIGDDVAQEKFIEHMATFGANVLQGGRFLHVSGHTDKGDAQAWLASQYKHHTVSDEFCTASNEIDLSTSTVMTIALGDGKNDIAMLEKADVAVQVRSPVHDFPTLKRTQQVYQSNEFGPAGWAECLQKILSSTLIY